MGRIFYTQPPQEISFFEHGGKHSLSAALSYVADLIWPERCVGCGALSTLLCNSCRQRLFWIEQRWACPDCGAPWGWLTCTECKHDLVTECCVSACVYSDVVAHLIKIYKDEHEARLAPVLASAIVCALDEASLWPPKEAQRLGSTSKENAERELKRMPLHALDIITYIPATTSAYIRRGFDHMKGVADALSRMLNITCVPTLTHHETKDQRLFNRAERKANMQGAFSATTDVAGARILLLDDVITTGATIQEAAAALMARGAECVYAAAVARAL